MSRESLEETVDRILIEGLSPRFKESIDRLRARGLSDRAILEVVQKFVAKANYLDGADPQRGRTTLGAVQAYLDSKPEAPCLPK